MPHHTDRSLMQQGLRLGENDNWIAGFCRYYGQPVISRDAAFERVAGLRRLTSPIAAFRVIAASG
jgi:predicted nucleic acid-binding protein